MSVFRSRPALRWLVPTAAAVAVIGGGAALGTIVASADPSLPDRSAAQLLVDVQNAKIDGLSGTIVQSADLGLSSIQGLTSGDADLSRLITGSNTAQVWYAGETKARVALQGTLGETDVVRNGSDVWLWSSKDGKATHLKVPAGSEKKVEGLASAVPVTPQEAADKALAAIDPTTAVSTTGAAKVAGRDAYELVLSPRDTASLVGQVRLAIDAEKHIPLRVDVYAKDATSPAIRVAFSKISFTTPDAEQFVFNPPAGTTTTEATPKELAKEHRSAVKKQGAAVEKDAKAAAEGMAVLGKGWTSVLSAKLPAATDAAKADAAGKGLDLNSMIKVLPEVSGAWGKGHLLSGSLFNVLVTDDGRVFAGAVSADTLYGYAAKK